MEPGGLLEHGQGALQSQCASGVASSASGLDGGSGIRLVAAAARRLAYRLAPPPQPEGPQRPPRGYGKTVATGVAAAAIARRARERAKEAAMLEVGRKALAARAAAEAKAAKRAEAVRGRAAKLRKALQKRPAKAKAGN